MDELINFFKLLSDETRLRIMVLLYHRELCVCQLCGILDISQPNVSKHLAKMRDMGFAKDERKEQYVFYSLNIENDIFKNILQNIIDNIEERPVLIDDIKNIREADKYFELCKS